MLWPYWPGLGWLSRQFNSMALVVFLSAAVFLTAGFAFLGMIWISVALRRLLRDGRRPEIGFERRQSVEPAE